MLLLRSFSNPILKYKPSTILLCFPFCSSFLDCFYFVSFSFSSFFCLLCPILLIYRKEARQVLVYFSAVLFKYMSLKSEVIRNPTQWWAERQKLMEIWKDNTGKTDDLEARCKSGQSQWRHAVQKPLRPRICSSELRNKKERTFVFQNILLDYGNRTKRWLKTPPQPNAMFKTRVKRRKGLRACQGRMGWGEEC